MEPRIEGHASDRSELTHHPHVPRRDLDERRARDPKDEGGDARDDERSGRQAHGPDHLVPAEGRRDPIRGEGDDPADDEGDAAQ